MECPCISKFVLIQHILSTQVSDKGPMVLWFQILFRSARNFSLSDNCVVLFHMISHVDG